METEVARLVESLVVVASVATSRVEKLDIALNASVVDEMPSDHSLDVVELDQTSSLVCVEDCASGQTDVGSVVDAGSTPVDELDSAAPADSDPTDVAGIVLDIDCQSVEMVPSDHEDEVGSASDVDCSEWDEGCSVVSALLQLTEVAADELDSYVGSSACEGCAVVDSAQLLESTQDEEVDSGAPSETAVVDSAIELCSAGKVGSAVDSARDVCSTAEVGSAADSTESPPVALDSPGGAPMPWLTSDDC